MRAGPLPTVTFVTIAGLVAACARGPAVPAIESFGPLDPAVASLVAEHLAAIEARPDEANRWGVLGMTLEANGLTPPAESAYATATTLVTDHGRWWYHLARLRARRGDSDGAVAAFDRAIALSPDYVPARWRRGALLLDGGDLDGAEAAFRVAQNLAPADAAALTGLARVHLARGRHAEAADLLERLVARTPGDRYPYQLLATAYRGLGRTTDAEEAVAAGASGEPRVVDAWTDEVGAYRRGFAARLKEATALGMAGQTAAAIEVLERLRDERPDDRELRTYLGGMYATAGRFAEAQALLDGVLQAHPDDFDAVMNLATAHLVDRRFDEADRLAERALALRPGDADAVRLRGVAAWRAGRLDLAERWLNEAAAANPGDAKALAWVGDIRRDRGRQGAALAAYRQALGRDPLLVEALVGGATSALATGARDVAAQWLGRAKRLAPGAPGVAELERQIGAAAR